MEQVPRGQRWPRAAPRGPFYPRGDPSGQEGTGGVNRRAGPAVFSAVPRRGRTRLRGRLPASPGAGTSAAPGPSGVVGQIGLRRWWRGSLPRRSGSASSLSLGSVHLESTSLTRLSGTPHPWRRWRKSAPYRTAKVEGSSQVFPCEANRIGGLKAEQISKNQCVQLGPCARALGMQSCQVFGWPRDRPKPSPEIRKLIRSGRRSGTSFGSLKEISEIRSPHCPFTTCAGCRLHFMRSMPRAS